MRTAKGLILTCSLLLAAGFAGCGANEPVGLVSGTALYADGSPIPEGTRVFFEQPGTGYVAVGIVASDGAYSLVYKRRPEIKPADYTVFIGPEPKEMTEAEFKQYEKKVAAEYRARGEQPPEAPSWVLPGKYYRVSTSPLRETVVVGENTINLTFEK